jgi:DNA-binding transcriptional MerR regulator
MNQLQELAQRQPNWPLDEFVQVANQLLAELLPDERVNTRVREVMTPRLVRHYTTQGMLDEPRKQGREARYSYRHLLQVLLLRRLLAAGYGAGAIAQFARTHSDSELETLLQGDVQLTLASTSKSESGAIAIAPTQSRPPTNSAVEFLQTIQANRSTLAAEPQPIAPSMAPSMAPSPAASLDQSFARKRDVSSPANQPITHWQRIELAPGLEIHLSDAFSCPSDPASQQQLLEHILQTLQSHQSSHHSERTPHDSTAPTQT